MKVWITKRALAQGIFEVESTTKYCESGMVAYKLPRAQYEEYAHGEGREWHRTEAAAKARAEQMRVAKIASLRKSIAKLEKLRF